MANKGALNPKFSTQQGKGSTSHGGIKPSLSHASERREDKDNDVINEDVEVVEEEDGESLSELWKEGRDDPKENILISLKKAVEQLKNKESSADDEELEYESDNEEKKKCKRAKSRKEEEESDKKKKKKKRRNIIGVKMKQM